MLHNASSKLRPREISRAWENPGVEVGGARAQRGTGGGDGVVAETRKNKRTATKAPHAVPRNNFLLGRGHARILPAHNKNLSFSLLRSPRQPARTSRPVAPVLFKSPCSRKSSGCARVRFMSNAGLHLFWRFDTFIGQL